jgi:hypothetical protein
MVTNVVQQRWLQALFSRDGYKRCSAEMVTSVVQHRWLQAFLSRDCHKHFPAAILTTGARIVQEKLSQELYIRYFPPDSVMVIF